MAGRRPLPLFVALLFLAAPPDAARSSEDADVLLDFKAAMSDPTGALRSWAPSSAPCGNGTASWAGIICDHDGSVSGLRLEGMSLSGSLNVGFLGRLPRLRTLSFTNNNFEGAMPDVGRLGSLRAVYLSTNKFSGEIPNDAFAGMNWVKKLYLSHNDFSGSNPASIAGLPKLMDLGLDDNWFGGAIPDLQVKQLKRVNLSNNDLEGRIPDGLRKMDADVLSGNKGLCGEPLRVPCQPPSPSPSPSSSSSLSTPSLSTSSGGSAYHPIIFTTIAIGLVVAVVAAIFIVPRRRQTKDDRLAQPLPPENSKFASSEEEKLEAGAAGCHRGGGGSGKKVAKDHEQRRLVFVREIRASFQLQDLLKSSAEVLGTGNFGCSYKATLSSGASVVVKRFRHMNRVGKGEFEEHMRRLGTLCHPNLLPLVAYYYRKDEKLVVTDYMANRSLANVLHVKGVVKGLNYLYEELQMLSVPHGHLKSSNVLLDDSLKPLLTDYALLPVMNQAQAGQFMAAYKSPECKQQGRTSKKSDVWSLGVLILEILTGKIPTTELQQEKGGLDLRGWVYSVPQEEWSSKVLDSELKAKKDSEGQMHKLMQIGLACCREDVDKRCELEEALDRIEELKGRDTNEDSARILTTDGEDDLSTVDIN
ncbi:hypothetical protein BHE74_00035302 [Ensete ventricosum]|nr:hypothetical protein BHE74_00035302 [Ensete ventricosum]